MGQKTTKVLGDRWRSDLRPRLPTRPERSTPHSIHSTGVGRPSSRPADHPLAASRRPSLFERDDAESVFRVGTGRRRRWTVVVLFDGTCKHAHGVRAHKRQPPRGARKQHRCASPYGRPASPTSRPSVVLGHLAGHGRRRPRPGPPRQETSGGSSGQRDGTAGEPASTPPDRTLPRLAGCHDSARIGRQSAPDRVK